MRRELQASLHRLRREGIDTRLVLQAYTAVAIVAGATMAGTGIRGLDGMGQEHASLIWIIGMAIVAAGCAAAGLSLNNDPVGRRQSLAWFAAGHLLLGLMVWMQWAVYWSTQGLPQPAALAPLAMGAVLLVAALSAVRDRAAESLTGTRSTYDEHIRQIARREERARLARDLHDAVKQQLFVIQTAAATVQARFDADAAGAREALSQVRIAAREATTEMEALLDELQAAPLETTGLVEALKKQCEALALRTGAQVRFQPGMQPAAGTLPPGAYDAVYRVAQEALANVARHARASRVDVSLNATTTTFKLRVADDGSGFDRNAARPGMGISNMEARAAEFGGHVSITPATFGTEVVLTLPLIDVAKRGAWATAQLFGLLVLFNVVFSSLRGHPIEQPGPWVMYVFGVLVIMRLVAAYRPKAGQKK